MVLSSLSALASAASAERAMPAAPSGAAQAADAAGFTDLVSAQKMEAAARAARDEAARFHHQTSRSGELKPLQKFEAFFLRNFVETMMPKDDTSFFGSGTAGQIWKSMLAERIGDEMAASGGIGIAEMIEKHEPGASDKT